MADKKVQWLEKVLGYALPGRNDGRLTAAAAAWRVASDAVDDQIKDLQDALKREADPELQEIGEFGLNAITGGFKVPLMAALQGALGGSSRDLAKLPAIIADFRDHLQDDEQVEACDDNPFGVAVSIRATLVPALDQLARDLGP